MNYGMYLSATGALTNMHRQDVIANNLANATTVGFKPDQVFFKAREVERLEDPSRMVDPSYVLEQLTGGHLVMPTRVSMEQGTLDASANPLDLAIQGDGFFVVRGGTPADPLRLTRDGRFAINGDSQLVLAATGVPVLDTDNRTIRLTPGAQVSIDGAGNIIEDGEQLTQLRVATVNNPAMLKKAGDNLFVFTGRAEDLRPATGAQIASGFVEASAVDPILTLNAMINATKSVQSNAKMIQYHDNLADQAINRFGRVA